MTTDDPITQFREAFARAVPLETFDASRCVLATATAEGRPSARFVLVKEIDERGFHFYTNYDSRKARDIAENPYAALAYHWSSIGIQVRVEGRVERLEEEISDRYFGSRPRGSQIGAWASPQSQPIESREELIARVAEADLRFGDAAIPRPLSWGGYRLIPDTIEFWYDGANRLHDRLLYQRRDGAWEMIRLAP